VNFANTWLSTNSQYREKKWYVFGEGSMGHCVPVVGHVFSQHFVGNFKGVGIGNADIDPNEQIKSIPMYLLQARSNLKIPPAGLKVCEMDSTIFWAHVLLLQSSEHHCTLPPGLQPTCIQMQHAVALRRATAGSEGAREIIPIYKCRCVILLWNEP
jgi:hypothetical protein